MVDNARRLEFLAGLLRGLTEYNDKLSIDEGKAFGERFATFNTVGAKSTTKAAENPINAQKNRYRNVLAYDHSRVILDTSISGGSDYINATWVDGFKESRRYIATQGPVPTTIPDFWAMIWQYNISIIIKVTREVENQTLKCHRYWPDPDSDPPQKIALIGQVEIEHIKSEHEETWIVRTFKLRHGSEERTISQFSYEAWPDHGVPLTAREFLDFRARIKTVEAKSPKAPVVVHCSAGVGRTGTYIVVDRVLECVENGVKSADLDIDRAIIGLRERRPSMVQTEAQYRFCYTGVLSGIRRELERYKGAKITPATKQFIESDKVVAQAADKKEDDDIAVIVKKRASNVKATSAAELDQVEKAWTKNESYDVHFEMSDLESRFVSLAMSGAEVDLTPAHPEQVKALVYKAKALDARKLQEREEIKTKEAERMAQQQYAVAEAQKVAEKTATKSAAAKKAEKFMRKKSNGALS